MMPGVGLPVIEDLFVPLDRAPPFQYLDIEDCDATLVEEAGDETKRVTKVIEGGRIFDLATQLQTLFLREHCLTRVGSSAVSAFKKELSKKKRNVSACRSAV
jgi:hypothetical protein